MLSSLRFRVLLLLAVLISVMAVYAIVRAQEQRRIELERLRADIHAHATHAVNRQEEIIANARLVLEAIAQAPEIRSGSPTECDAELTKLLRVRTRYLQLSVLNPLGTVDCSAVLPDRLPRIDRVADWPSFRRAMSGNGFVAGEYQVEPVSGRQFLDVALPLFNREGEVRAVILTAVDLEWLGDSIGAQLLPEGSVVELVRVDGTLAARYPHLPAFVGKSIAASEFYTAMQSNGFSGSFKAAGLDRVTRAYEVFALRAGGDASAGYTVVGIPEATAIQAIDEQLKFELIDLGALALIMLLGGYLVSDILFSRPIRALTAMSRQIEAGNRGVRSGLESTMGEIGTLGRSMDRMMAAIETYEGLIMHKRQQLSESQHFAKLFSWRWVPATGAFDVSDSIYSILGVEPDAWEPTYNSLLKFAHPEDRHRINEAVARAIEAKSTYFIEYRAVRPDGDVRDFWERARCELGANGEVVAVSGIVQDITLLKGTEREHQRAIDALHRSEDQFRSMIDVSPVAMALVGLDGTWLQVNEAFGRIVGHTTKDLMATRLQTITHPDELQGKADPVLEIESYDAGDYQVERRLICRGGHSAWVLLTASLVRNGNGMPLHFILQMNDISERRAIQLALKASEERYRRLLQVIPDAVTVHRNTQLEFVNDAAVELFGAGRAHEVLGRSLLEFVSPNSQSALQDHARRLQEVGRVAPLMELQVRRPDGTSIDVEATSCSLSHGEGRLVVTIFRDITQRRLGEQALRDSEEQLRLLADSLPILLARVDSNGRYRFLNREGERRCGVQRSEVIGRSLADVLGAAEFEKIRPYFSRSLSGESVTFSTRIRYPNGEERDVEIFYIPDLAPDGAVRGVFMVSIDVTDRATAQAELRENERRFRLLVESTNAVPYTWSLSAQRYTYLGPQAERLFGHPAERLADRLFWIQQIHPDDQQQVLMHLQRLEADRHDAQIEYRIVRNDGKVLWLNDTVTVETTADGEKVAHGIIVDMTENKLRDRQIEQTQKIEALGQMTGGIAHDFNNLLTVIVINLELVERQLSGATEKHRVSQAIRAANAGTELASRMLAFARRQVLRPTQIDLNSMVAEFHSMLRRTLDATIETKMKLADDVWPVRVDRAALEAALLNLTVNARDAMPDGGLLTIRTGNVAFDAASAARRPGLRPGEYAMLAVSDTGMGMTPEVLARAFEPFFTTKDTGKGTGLGLSMVYGFVKQSHSFAYIDSEQGRGTTVSLYFPRAEIRELTPISDLSKPEEMPIGSETILVVEDSAAVRTAASSLLTSLGYRVLEANDGPSALRLIDEEPGIDLVLSDVVMPGGMKGPDLARRALERRPNIKLLYMSGYADDPNFREGTVEPHAELISKPFHSETLAAKVRSVLDTRKAPRRRSARRGKAGA